MSPIQNPRGCTPPVFPTSGSYRLRNANSFAHKQLQPLLPLFALFSALSSFVFNILQPLFRKHPGGGEGRPGRTKESPIKPTGRMPAAPHRQHLADAVSNQHAARGMVRGGAAQLRNGRFAAAKPAARLKGAARRQRDELRHRARSASASSFAATAKPPAALACTGAAARATRLPPALLPR